MRKERTWQCHVTCHPDQPRGRVPCVPSTTRYQSALQLSSAHTSVLSSPTGPPGHSPASARSLTCVPEPTPQWPRPQTPGPWPRCWPWHTHTSAVHPTPQPGAAGCTVRPRGGSRPKLLMAPGQRRGSRAAARGGPCPYTSFLVPRGTPPVPPQVALSQLTLRVEPPDPRKAPCGPRAPGVHRASGPQSQSAPTSQKPPAGGCATPPERAALLCGDCHLNRRQGPTRGTAMPHDGTPPVQMRTHARQPTDSGRRESGTGPGKLKPQSHTGFRNQDIKQFWTFLEKQQNQHPHSRTGTIRIRPGAPEGRGSHTQH